MTTAIMALLLGAGLGGPVPLTSLEGPSIACEYFNVDNSGFHKPMSVCWNRLSGEVLGAITRRNGKVFCPVRGQVDLNTGCLSVTICGQGPFTDC